MASTTTRRLSTDRSVRSQNPATTSEILTEDIFRRMISLERKRSERTQRPFVLLLMDTGRDLPTEKNGRILLEILNSLQAATRETDVMGWYESNSVVGVMFTEITPDNNLILSTILSRISDVLSGRLTNEQFSQIKFSFHLFPEEWDPTNPERPNAQMPNRVLGGHEGRSGEDHRLRQVGKRENYPHRHSRGTVRRRE